MYKWVISFLFSLILIGSLISIGLSYGFFLTNASKHEMILGSIILALMTLLIYEWVFDRKDYKKKLREELSKESNNAN